MLGGKLMFGHQDDDQQTLNDQVSSTTATTDTQNASWSAPQLDDGHDELGSDPVESDTAAPTQTSAPAPVNDQTVSAPSDGQEEVPLAADDELLDIKQQALSQLSPLVSHLEQAPEERFRTLMMMIQASDNQSLVKAAYETAQQIPDEKEKAQALLDIVNEINYFTHKGQEN